MKRYINILIIASFLLFGYQLRAQEAIWLSNTPPEDVKEMFRASGMHRWSAFDNRKIKESFKKKNRDTTLKTKEAEKSQKRSYRPATKYVQWIKKGSGVNDSQYTCIDKSTPYELYLYSPSNKKEKIELVNEKACYITFEMNEEGFYNAYLITKKVQNDTLYVNVAKGELINHSCRNGHHKKLEARPVRIYPEISPFEVYRKRQPYEDYHYFSFSGGDETFKAVYKGKPLTGVKITINTEKGWQKKMTSDENGEISFRFIQDYFSEWKELEHRKIFHYLLVAEHTIEETGNFQGENYNYIRYTLTLSDGYRPSKTMYSSMLWGLAVFVITLIVTIAGIFIYKERRKRPYKEIEFNESNR